MIFKSELGIVSIIQMLHELPPDEYFLKSGIDFEKVYIQMLKSLSKKLSLNEYRKVNIIIDSRSHRGGVFGALSFKKEMDNYFRDSFPDTKINFQPTPSYQDVLLELADFISNTLYQAYQKEDDRIFSQLGFRLIQIKDPLKKRGP